MRKQMNTENTKPFVSWLWKVPAIAITFFFGVMASGAVITAMKMPWPTLPESLSQTSELMLSLVGSLLMAVCLALLARGIRGSQGVRWFVLTLFAYVTYGLNNQIESTIFTTYGGFTTMLLFYTLPCALGAAAAVKLFQPEEHERLLDHVFAGRSVAQWGWRVVVAWLAFPVIYLAFGMLAAPFVVPVYQTQDFGLTLPGMGTIIPVALGRSAIYLAATIPLIVIWSRSQRSLLWSLAISFFAMMGLIGLLTATFFPPVLRVTHSIEILGDAIVYSWLLVALFIPKARPEVNEAVPAIADS
jgi:hypothetical protein